MLVAFNEPEIVGMKTSRSVVCGEVNVLLQLRSSSSTGAAAVAPKWLSAAVRLK